MRTAARALAALLLITACRKVSLDYTPAKFSLAQAIWFEAEQTLFFFWKVGSPLGLGNDAVVEVRYQTDDGPTKWTEPKSLANVHEHLAVDCGEGKLCGSASPRVAKEPRFIEMRLRYHHDGDVAKKKIPLEFVVHRGTAHENRSLVVYGVFDETNRYVQWRARHQFPAFRNEEATRLGLRRTFTITGQTYGVDAAPWIATNPYHYGQTSECPADFTSAEIDTTVTTSERAAFNTTALPVSAATATSVCAVAHVVDGTGTFVTNAYARKNPETRAAFSTLHSPVKSTVKVGFLLAPCTRTISSEHLEMQKQRLLLEDFKTVCTDSVSDPGFSTTLTSTIQASVSAARAAGRDMTLFIALHHDDITGTLEAKVEEALAATLPAERAGVSPRVSGAFIFDTIPYLVRNPEVKKLALWCPALSLKPTVDSNFGVPDESQVSCPVLPDVPGLKLGPFSLGSIPILPTRKSYEKFIDKYSEAQAGEMKSIGALAPERTTTSTDVALDEFGWVTFFNNERITATETDGFSFCSNSNDSLDASRFYFRTDADPETPLPISALPEIQATAPQSDYELGLLWDFPFLLRLEYTSRLAGAANAVVASVPFGFNFSQKDIYGSEGWIKSDFSLAASLTQCTRFCTHPGFEKSGVYGAGQSWRTAFAERCYRPRFPKRSDGGFPDDP
jgi:hypothetical protein